MNILIAHDGSAGAGKALGEAAKMAEKFGAALKILSVVPDLCLSTEELSADECQLASSALDQETRGVMKKVMDELTTKGLSAELIVKAGRPVDQILDTAAEVAADLIVVGSHGRHGAWRFLLGGVSTQVVSHAKCNVLVVK